MCSPPSWEHVIGRHYESVTESRCVLTVVLAYILAVTVLPSPWAAALSGGSVALLGMHHDASTCVNLDLRATQKERRMRKPRCRALHV
jgi:hypothetical protein